MIISEPFIRRPVATTLLTIGFALAGMVACTEMVGKSTCGSGDTGSLKKATAPAAASPMVRSVVATGRRMKGLDGSMVQTDPPLWPTPAGRPANRTARRSNQR